MAGIREYFLRLHELMRKHKLTKEERKELIHLISNIREYTSRGVLETAEAIKHCETPEELYSILPRQYRMYFERIRFTPLDRYPELYKEVSHSKSKIFKELFDWFVNYYVKRGLLKKIGSVILVPVRAIEYKNKIYSVPENLNLYVSLKNPNQYYKYSPKTNSATQLTKQQVINLLVKEGIIPEHEKEAKIIEEDLSKIIKTEENIYKQLTQATSIEKMIANILERLEKLEQKMEQLTSGAAITPMEIEREIQKTIRYLKRLGIDTDYVEIIIESLIRRYGSLDNAFEIADLPPIKSFTIKIAPNYIEIPPRYMLAFKRALECFRETILAMYYKSKENPLKEIMKYFWYGANHIYYLIDTVRINKETGLYEKCEYPYITLFWLYCFVQYLVNKLQSVGYGTGKISEIFERGRIEGNKIVF